MKKLFWLVALLVPYYVKADLYTFPTLRFGRAFAGLVNIDVTWADKTYRDVSLATGSITVYKKSPMAGNQILFTKSFTPTGTPSYRMLFSVTSTDTTPPGTYYAEIKIIDGVFTDVLHGQVIIEGQ